MERVDFFIGRKPRHQFVVLAGVFTLLGAATIRAAEGPLETVLACTPLVAATLLLSMWMILRHRPLLSLGNGLVWYWDRWWRLRTVEASKVDPILTDRLILRGEHLLFRDKGGRVVFGVALDQLTENDRSLLMRLVEDRWPSLRFERVGREHPSRGSKMAEELARTGLWLFPLAPVGLALGMWKYYQAQQIGFYDVHAWRAVRLGLVGTMLLIVVGTVFWTILATAGWL